MDNDETVSFLAENRQDFLTCLPQFHSFFFFFGGISVDSTTYDEICSRFKHAGSDCLPSRRRTHASATVPNILNFSFSLVFFLFILPGKDDCRRNSVDGCVPVHRAHSGTDITLKEFIFFSSLYSIPFWSTNFFVVVDESSSPSSLVRERRGCDSIKHLCM